MRQPVETKVYKLLPQEREGYIHEKSLTRRKLPKPHIMKKKSEMNKNLLVMFDLCACRKGLIKESFFFIIIIHSAVIFIVLIRDVCSNESGNANASPPQFLYRNVC